VCVCFFFVSFYNKIFEDQFHMCLEFPAQNRYIVAFPLICGHFQSCTHELCPEEVSYMYIDCIGINLEGDSKKLIEILNLQTVLNVLSSPLCFIDENLFFVK